MDSSAQAIVQQTLIMDVSGPDGKVYHLGRVFRHRNPIVNFVLGGFFRWRLERGIARFNATTAALQTRVLAEGEMLASADDDARFIDAEAFAATHAAEFAELPDAVETNSGAGGSPISGPSHGAPSPEPHADDAPGAQ